MYERVANEVPIGLHVLEESGGGGGGGGGSRGVVFLDDEAHTHHDFATFRMPPGANDYFADLSQFLPLTPALLRRVAAAGVPAATSSYYQRCSALDCVPLTFFHVPHVLIRGELSVEGCRVVRWSDDLDSEEHA